MTSFLRFKPKTLLASGVAIALLTTSVFALVTAAKKPNDPIAKLPQQEQSTLKSGQGTLSGEKGNYIGRIIVAAPTNVAWGALSDYDNFESFFPRVENSQLLEARGPNKVFRKDYFFDFLVFSKRVSVRIAATEIFPKQIQFRLIEGDVESLEGLWQIDPITTKDNTSYEQILLTHTVMVKPKSSSVKAIFYSIYEDTIEVTLAALKKEMESRAAK